MQNVKIARVEKVSLDVAFIYKLIMILQNLSIFFADALNAITSIQVICLILYLAYFFVFRQGVRICRFLTAWLVYVFVVMLNLLIGGDVYFVIAFIVCNVIMYLQLSLPGYAKFEWKLLKIFSWIHLIASVCVYVLPQATMDSILKILLRDNYLTNYSWRVIAHVNPGMTTQPGTNAMFLTILFMIYAVDMIVTGKHKVKDITIMLFSFAMILTTAKRSAMLLLIVSIVIFYCMVRKCMGRKLTPIKAIGSVILVAAVVFLTHYAYTATQLFTALLEKTSGLSSSNDMSNGRVALWTLALDEFWRNPVFGIGLKNIYAMTGFDVHNTYIQVLVETGAIGATVFAVAIIQIIRHSMDTVKKVFSSSGLEEEKKCVGTGSVLMIFLLLYGVVGNTFIDYIPMMLFCVATVMINNRKEKDKVR